MKLVPEDRMQDKDQEKVAPAALSVRAETLSNGLARTVALGLDAGLRVGIDLVHIRRIEESLHQLGERFEQRMFAAGEVAYARAAPAQRAERLAARFAAKEALIKALGWSEAGVDWREMEVVRGEQGDCSLALHGKAAALALRAGVTFLRLSLTHDGDYAAAVVVAALSDKSGQSASAESVA